MHNIHVALHQDGAHLPCMDSLLTRIGSVAVLLPPDPAPPETRVLAQHLGRSLARAGAVLVYDGTRGGIGGALADAALAHEGHVIGIAEAGTEAVRRHPHLAEFRDAADAMAAETMRNALTDATVVLPGALPLSDPASWAQAAAAGGRRRIGLLGPAAALAPLVAALDVAAAEGRLDAATRGAIVAAEDVRDLLMGLDADAPARRRGVPLYASL